MLGIFGFLLILWIVLAVFGLVLKGLLWLTVLAAIAFVITAGWIMFSRSGSVK